MIEYLYSTKAGTFRIIQGQNGWQCWFEDEYFDGLFTTAQAAAEEAANGHGAWPSCGDPSRFGLSEDISDWRASRRSR